MSWPPRYWSFAEFRTIIPRVARRAFGSRSRLEAPKVRIIGYIALAMAGIALTSASVLMPTAVAIAGCTMKCGGV